MTQRPVIPGFHPDPSVCRVGEWFYLATSSFEYAPGVPIFRSRDLQTWEQIGHALQGADQLDVSMSEPSGGVFAPTLRHHDGRFWMITTNWSDGGGQLVVTAGDPAGPWAPAVRFPSIIGIDPDLAWDINGTCYLTYAGFGPHGSEGIQQVVVDPASGQVLSEKRALWSGTGAKFPEGPHLYDIDGTWYLLIAEGGTERGHSISIARGPSPTGPFESFDGNPLLTQRGTDHPVQNTGHGDLAQRADGSWSIVYHGVRHRGGSPQWHVLGREVLVDDVEWTDGWPRLTAHVPPPLGHTDVVIRDLPAAVLPHDWVGANCFVDQVMESTSNGWTVRPHHDGPSFVGRRQEHLYARVTARVQISGRGGLALRIDPRHQVSLEIVDGNVEAALRVGDLRQVLGLTPFFEGDALEIRAVPAEGSIWSASIGPDRIEVGVRRDAGFQTLGSVDGRYLSTEVAGGMTGRLFGVLCEPSSEVTVLTWEYAGTDDPAAITPYL